MRNYYEDEVRARKERGHSDIEISYELGITQTRVECCILGESVVRVVIVEDQEWPLIHSLQEAGYIKVHRKDQSICFDILPPSNKPSASWAENLAAYMTTYGFNAVVAPRWADE